MISQKVFKRRLIFVYTTLILTFIIYVAGETYSYSLQLNQNNLMSDISQSQLDLEELNVRINTLISRESISEDYPNLKLDSENIFYLERVEDDEQPNA